ncbi:hypothetical protein NP493_23g05044 [Ridgeia piscesae]|uniref:Uncharacterized protein n=1 Tax=Ridgeia piscesae TaxID=27915 RepID=A0AAD9PDX8_RIDPI|nr:hypothetical protein NP493_23g05044 [Ridgeia piscesae]
MYSSTITLNMHEYKKQMYSSTSTITLQYTRVRVRLL